MRQLKTNLFVAVGILLLGTAAATLWTTHHFNLAVRQPARISDEPNLGSQTERNVPADWQGINIEGNAAFFIPPGLRPVIHDTGSLYKAFRNDSMEVFMYYPSKKDGTCILTKNESLVTKAKVTKTTVGGRDATMEHTEKTSFGLEDDRPILKGFIICVPDPGDGEHEFVIVGKYKSDQDYQILRRIIDSIRFPHINH